MSELSLADLGLGGRQEPPLVKGFRFKPIMDLMRETVSLTEADMQVLAVRGPEHSQTQIKHIRAYHHMVALRLAAGERAGQIAMALGLTAQTITKLQASPQFDELVESYRGQIVERTIDHATLMSVVSAEALTALHERLIGDDRDEIPIETLRRLSETFVDRIGHSPIRRSQTSSVHRIELDSQQIQHIKALHSENRRFTVPLDPNSPDIIDAAVVAHEAATNREGASGGAAVAFLPSRSKPEADPDAGSGQSL